MFDMGGAECRECHGTGIVECNCGCEAGGPLSSVANVLHDCRTCDGTGVTAMGNLLEPEQAVANKGKRRRPSKHSHPATYTHETWMQEQKFRVEGRMP